jgi:hypothetical protein
MTAGREGGSGESGISVENMREVIQTAVQAAMAQVNTASLDDSVKKVNSSALSMVSLTTLHWNNHVMAISTFRDTGLHYFMSSY